MPYLDIIFHNVQQGGAGRIDGANSRYTYTVGFPNRVNVCQTPNAAGAGFEPATPAYPARSVAGLGWGNNITAAGGAVGGACGIFFCESSPYPYIPGTHYHVGAWTSTNFITSPPYFKKWFYPAFDPNKDTKLTGYSGCTPVDGWIPLPGWNCEPGEVPAFPIGGINWLPPLRWSITNDDAPYDEWFGRPQWNGADWAIPPAPAPAYSAVPDLTLIQHSFIPSGGNNFVCAFLEGLPDAAPPAGALPALPARNWLGKRNPNCALQCVGTGDPNIYNTFAPPGSDRYAVYFQATHRTYPDSSPIKGLFVHTKNTGADTGTQLAALCRRFPNEIIFGDLNFDLRIDLKRQSLEAAVGETHVILAIQQASGLGFYCTRYQAGGGGTSCIDFALIPRTQIRNVELWARDPGEAVRRLDRNNSDHSVMMLRIHCN